MIDTNEFTHFVPDDYDLNHKADYYETNAFIYEETHHNYELVYYETAYEEWWQDFDPEDEYFSISTVDDPYEYWIEESE